MMNPLYVKYDGFVVRGLWGEWIIRMCVRENNRKEDLYGSF